MVNYSTSIMAAPRVEIPLVGVRITQEDSSVAAALIKASIRMGVRSIDIPDGYPHEKEVGIAIRECMKHRIVKRNEIFISKNIWVSEICPLKIGAVLRTSLDELGLGYVDLLAIHTPAKDGVDLSSHTVSADVKVWDLLKPVYQKRNAKSVSVTCWKQCAYEHFISVQNKQRPHQEVTVQMLSPFANDWHYQTQADPIISKIGKKNAKNPRRMIASIIMPTVNVPMVSPWKEFFFQNLDKTLVNGRTKGYNAGILDVIVMRFSMKKFLCLEVGTAEEDDKEKNAFVDNIAQSVIWFVALILAASVISFLL